MNKKIILVAVWLALLGGLGVWISHSNSSGTVVPLPPGGLQGHELDLDIISHHWPIVVSHAAAPPRGKADTPFTLAEFGDFQCPQCAKVRPILEQALARYPDKVNLIFIHRPFPFRNDGSVMHEWAIPSAEASEFAAAHGKFWQMYDELYENQDRLQPGFYSDYAAKIGLDQTQFQAAFNAHTYRAKVQDAQNFSDTIHIDQTPTILLWNKATGKVTSYVGQAGVQDMIASPPWGK